MVETRIRHNLDNEDLLGSMVGAIPRILAQELSRMYSEAEASGKVDPEGVGIEVVKAGRLDKLTRGSDIEIKITVMDVPGRTKYKDRRQAAIESALRQYAAPTKRLYVGLFFCQAAFPKAY